MALSNGDQALHDRYGVQTQHLGKRKRSESTEPDGTATNGIAPTHQNLEDAFRLVKQHDLTASITSFPLPTRSEHIHADKKLRSNANNHDPDTIAYRMSHAVYETIEDLVSDIQEVKTQVIAAASADGSDTKTNPDIRTQLDDILNCLSDFHPMNDNDQTPTPPAVNGIDIKRQESPSQPSSQVLSLRSHTEHGIRQLFSGLPSNIDSANSVRHKLPNGFEFAQTLNMSKGEPHRKDRRKFGEVFATARNAKPLEMPKASRSSRDNQLNFVKPYEHVPFPNKKDFKIANLKLGEWLKYDEPRKSKGDSTDSKHEAITKNISLFKAAFSSFAPSVDSSLSGVPMSVKSQRWLRQNNLLPSTHTLASELIQLPAPKQVESGNTVTDQDLEDMVANYIPEEAGSSETEDILGEISELIDTLTSYQSIRNLEIARGPSSASKPSRDEQTIYAMLRDQIQLLVSSLPPFAIAKLNGDQLEELNISTHLLIEPADFIGTAQADEYTVRRNRAAQAATSAAVRNTAPAPAPNRPSYSTPASAYNAQARAYNHVPTPAYGQRPVPPSSSAYHTPRLNTNAQVGGYTQSQYRSSAPSIHTPSIQQFQRSMVNGHTSPTANHTPYLQRPTQPGYQQRAQDSVAYSRPDTVGKSLMNGDAPQYQPRQYNPPNHIPMNMSNAVGAMGQSHPTAETVRHRQTSGTPQPSIEAVRGIATS